MPRDNVLKFPAIGEDLPLPGGSAPDAAPRPAPTYRSDPVRGVRPIPTSTYALLDRFAEEHQLEVEDACRDSLYGEVSDALFWLMLGAFGGAVAVLLSLYIMAQMVRP